VLRRGDWKEGGTTLAGDGRERLIIANLSLTVGRSSPQNCKAFQAIL